MSYHHFTIDERESILIYRTQGLNFSQIAKLLHRHPSSISREWKRHLKEGSAIQNQELILQIMHRNRTIMPNHTVGGNGCLK